MDFNPQINNPPRLPQDESTLIVQAIETATTDIVTAINNL